MIKFWVGLLAGILLMGAIGLGVYIYIQQTGKDSNGAKNNSGTILEIHNEKPLERFSFPRLAQTVFDPTQIEVLEEQAKGAGWTSNKIVYTWEGRKISGQLTRPDSEKFPGKRPVIVMVRGFVPIEQYETGIGTRNAARVYATNGFVTISTDFLGFGDSDNPENDIWWERFSKPSQVIQLIKSLETLPDVDVEKVGIWGHSNGGQITLSVLEITGKKYPASLWAPVSVSFPYSVLYFTEGTDDDGMEIRRSLANWEWSYDARSYSISSYLNMIKSPILLHQGSEDPDVLQSWSDALVKKLKSLDAEITYHVYPGADHNLQPAWQTVVNRDVEFYKEKLNTE